jgi:hypothetical protein
MMMRRPRLGTVELDVGGRAALALDPRGVRLVTGLVAQSRSRPARASRASSARWK